MQTTRATWVCGRAWNTPTAAPPLLPGRYESGIKHITRRLRSLRELVERHPDKEFLIVNRMLPTTPWMNTVSYFVRDGPGGDKVFEDLLTSYMEGKDEARDLKLKYIPKIPNASWVLRGAVAALGGFRPVIMGKGCVAARRSTQRPARLPLHQAGSMECARMLDHQSAPGGLRRSGHALARTRTQEVGLMVVLVAMVGRYLDQFHYRGPNYYEVCSTPIFSRMAGRSPLRVRAQHAPRAHVGRACGEALSPPRGTTLSRHLHLGVGWYRWTLTWGPRVLQEASWASSSHSRKNSSSTRPF